MKSGNLMNIPGSGCDTGACTCAGLEEDDLVKRYLGAVFWHSAANFKGKLDADAYDRAFGELRKALESFPRGYCYKPTRHESAKEAFENDRVAAEAMAIGISETCVPSHSQ